jgi:multiple sugar transport system substrate-binding protein/raffinose/stachyose/melibiose transport system substrate-binding protein
MKLKSMRTKIAITFFLSIEGLFLALFLSACSQQDTASESVTHLPKTTITALVWAPDWPEQMQQIANEFSKQHPQIEVNVQFMIGNSVEENIKPKIAANKIPDLISVNPNSYAAGLAEQGILADLSESAAWANMLDSLKADWSSGSGKHYGISGGVAATLMYYNKDMFKKAGITALPTNFDEFLKVCERLKKAGFTPIVWNGGFPNILGNGPFSFGFANNVIAKQPDWKKKISDGSLDLNTPEVADIFSKIKLVADRGYVQPGYMNTGYDEGIKLFTDGKTAMAFQGSWASGMLMNGKDFKTGVFVPPWNAAGKKVIPVIGSETGFAVCETRNKKAAIQFLDFMYGKAFAIQQNKRQNIPPLKQMQAPAVSDPQITAYIQTVAQSSLAASPYYSFLPASTISLLHPLLQDVLSGKTSPQDAAKALDQSIKEEAQKNHQ